MDPQLQSAVQNFLVNCVGGGFLVIIYFALSLLSPYLVPLFWASVLSVPLFDIKKIVVDYIEEDLKDDEITLFGVLLTTIHVGLSWSCDPFYLVLHKAFNAYLGLVSSAFTLPIMESPVESPSISDGDASPGKKLAEKSLQEQKQIVSDRLRSKFNDGTFFYFRMLLSAGTGFFLYDFIIVKKLGVLLGFLLTLLLVIHLIFHLSRLTFYKYCPQSIKQYIFKYSKSKTKSFVLNNASSLLTYFIVFGSIITGICVGIFLSFKCVGEFQQFMSTSIDFVDVHLQGDLKDQMHSQLHNAYSYGTDYIDEQSFMKNSNMTSKDLSLKVKSMFHTLPVVQSIYGNLTNGHFNVLWNTTIISSAFNELSSSSYSENEKSVFAQIKAAASNFVSQIAQNVLMTGLSVFSSIFGVLFSMLDWFFKIIVFLTVLLYLVNNKHSIIHYLRNTLSMVDPKNYIVDALENCISSTFSVNFRLGLFYFFFTLITFYACDVQLIYFPSIISSILAILPFVNPMVISILPSLSLWLQGHLIKSILLLLSHVLASFMIIPLFHEEIKGVDTYFGSLSIALGIYSYGLEGVIVGPILMSLIPAGYHFLKFYLK